MSASEEGTVSITKKDEARVFSPLEFLAELSTHIPNTWEQTTRYYGVFAARTWGAAASKKRIPKEVSKYWVTWIRKIYNVDPLCCPKCGSQMKIVAFIHDSKEITAIARNRGLQPYRAPPSLVPKTKESAPEIIPFWE